MTSFPTRLIPAALGAAAAAAGLRHLLRRRRRRDHASTAERRWTCACGEEYRVVGSDRHRVLWPAGGTQDEAVMGGECPSCGRPLEVGAS